MLIDFNNTTDIVINLENILKIVNEESVYRYYYPGKFYIGLHKSPFRNDRKSSFSIYITRGRIKWRDHSTGERGDCVDLVMKVTGLTQHESLERIYLDLIKNTSVKRTRIESITPEIDLSINSKPYADIKIVNRVSSYQDDLYWLRYNITRDIRDSYYTGVADKVYLNNKLWATYSNHNPIYYYYFPDTDHLKIYRPFEKNSKWLGNVDNNQDIQGYYQCDIKNREIGLLVLTKSMKDVMFLRSFGIDAMAINGENHEFNADFIRHLRKYCKNIVSLYDNDKAGVLAALKLWRTHHIPAIFIPRRWESKDTTDLWIDNKPKCILFINKLKAIRDGIYTGRI